jgi:hypothetical protein
MVFKPGPTVQDSLVEMVFRPTAAGIDGGIETGS